MKMIMKFTVCDENHQNKWNCCFVRKLTDLKSYVGERNLRSDGLCVFAVFYLQLLCFVFYVTSQHQTILRITNSIGCLQIVLNILLQSLFVLWDFAELDWNLPYLLICIHTIRDACTYTCTYIHTYIYIYIYIYIHIELYMHTHIYIYIYIYTHRHTHI